MNLQRYNTTCFKYLNSARLYLRYLSFAFVCLLILHLYRINGGKNIPGSSFRDVENSFVTWGWNQNGKRGDCCSVSIFFLTSLTMRLKLILSIVFQICRLIPLMQKYCKKLVTKVIYINILSASEATLRATFLSQNGWIILISWSV